MQEQTTYSLVGEEEEPASSAGTSKAAQSSRPGVDRKCSMVDGAWEGVDSIQSCGK
jgi:hypothetical protein